MCGQSSRDYCSECKLVTDCRVVHHANGDETICLRCESQVDFDFQDDEPHEEAVGSCEVCGTNLYLEDDDELCDQCLWRSMF